MSVVDKAIETQLKNIEMRTGKSLAELAGFILTSGLSKHGEIRDMLKRDLGMGHGDANTLVHHVLKNDGMSAAKDAGKSLGDAIEEIYSGAKAELRPIHEALLAEIVKFGDFETAPKKGYISLRRKKQFAMIGPATNTRVEVGINAKDLTATERLAAMPAGGMCNFKVKLTEAGQVDAELIAWLRHAYMSAG